MKLNKFCQVPIQTISLYINQIQKKLINLTRLFFTPCKMKNVRYKVEGSALNDDTARFNGKICMDKIVK